MHDETTANGNESACSFNSFCSTQSNLQENDDDNSCAELADLLPDLTNNNQHEEDDDECCGESAENMPYSVRSDRFVLCKQKHTPNEDFSMSNVVSKDEESNNDDPNMKSWRDSFDSVEYTANDGKGELQDFLLSEVRRANKPALKMLRKSSPNMVEFLVHYFGIDSELNELLNTQSTEFNDHATFIRLITAFLFLVLNDSSCLSFLGSLKDNETLSKTATDNALSVEKHSTL